MANHKQKSQCINGHELSPENTYQTYKNGMKNGRKCRQCGRDDQKVYRGEHPQDFYRRRIESQMRLRYGINSIEERDALLTAQGGACAACGRTDCKWGRGWLNVWHIDHKHGKVGTHRGILCARCNVIVGILETSSVFIQKCRD